MDQIKFSYTLGFLLLVFLWIKPLNAQLNAFNKDPFLDYHTGIELYNQAVFGMAKLSFEQFLTHEIVQEPEFNLFRTRGEYYRALCALHLDDPEGVPMLVSWLRSHPQDPKYHEAGFTLGNYYYNEKQYLAAVDAYDRVNPDLLTKEQSAEMSFKKGYCLFVQKDFTGSKEIFILSKDVRNQYFDAVNYYYGMSNYFLGDYEEAIASFDRCLNSPRYRATIPYYISQIYFEQERYDELIQFSEKYLDRKDIKKQEELHQLVGQSFFIKGDYEAALPHLEYYESHSRKLTEEEFYLLAFTQYQTGNYPKAIENFLELTRVQNSIGQSSNFYLADCYLKLGDKASAMAAFKQVSQSDYDQEQQEEATFQYAKLAAEQNLESEAISTLLKIDSNSAYFADSQELLSELLIRTADYPKAIEILNAINPRSLKLETALQKAHFLLAIQKYLDGNKTAAIDHFTAVIQTGENWSYKAQSYFWLAKEAQTTHEYPQSISYLDSYFSIIHHSLNIPVESSVAMAHYTQGYNYFKLKEYPKSADQFDKSIKALHKVKPHNLLQTNTLMDATIRLADSYFKMNEYPRALTNYEYAIEQGHPSGAYAYYQKSTIEGLMSRPYDKILSLEEMINTYPRDPLTDDALLLLGNTYLALNNKGLAEKVYRKLVNDFEGKSPLVNTANLKLGLISYNLGDAERALSYYQSVIHNNPTAKESQEAMLAIEEIYVEDIGDSEAYISFVESIPGQNLTEFSKDSISYYIAENQFKNGNYQTAIERLTNYLQRFPEGFYTIPALYYRAECYSLTRDYEKALEDYKRITNQGISEFYETSLNKAALISYNHQQDFRNAFELYQSLEAFTVDPEVKKAALEGMLNSASRIPDPVKVVEVSGIMLRDSLMNADDIAHIHFLRGKSLMQLEDMVAAIASFKNASANSSNYEAAEARYLIGKILYDLEDYEDAENETKTAIRKNKSYSFWVAKSLILLSDIYVAKNSLLKARAALEAVIENYNGDPDLLKISQERLAALEEMEAAQNRIKAPVKADTLELEEQQ